MRVGDGAENNAERNVAYPRCANVTFPGMVLDLNAVVPGEQPGSEQRIESYAN